MLMHNLILRILSSLSLGSVTCKRVYDSETTNYTPRSESPLLYLKIEEERVIPTRLRVDLAE